MDIETVLTDKIKAKAKVEAISQMLLTGKVTVADLIKTAKASANSEKGTCIEAIQFATKTKPELASTDVLKFVTEALLDKAPRVKWESAKVIAAIAHLYPNKLDRAIGNLLTNTEFSGAVVRWSAALALGEIVKLKTKMNKDLVPAVQAIIRREEDNAIKKIYLTALKKAGNAAESFWVAHEALKVPHKAGKIGHGPKQIGHEAVLVASEGQKMVHEAEKVSHKALKLVVQFRARVKFGCDVQSSMVSGKIAVVKSDPKTIRQVIISAHGLWYTRDMTIKRLDHVSVVVDDLAAAIAFFTALGMTKDGEARVEGPWVDRINALESVQVDIVMMRTPDGQGRLELTKFRNPQLVGLEPAIAPPNTLGLRSVMFTVVNVDDTVARLRSIGAELVGEVAQYEDKYRLCYMRGPAGIIVALAEELF